MAGQGGWGQGQGWQGQPQQWPQPHQPAKPPEPEAHIRYPGPVGAHWPVDPNVLYGLPTRPVLQVAQLSSAQVVLSIESSVPHILHECATIFAADKLAEQKRKSANVTAIIFLVLGFFTIWIFGLGVVFLIIAGIIFYRGSKHAVFDVEDRRLEIVSGVMTTLAQELKANRPVKVIADFGLHEARPPMLYNETGTGLFEQKRTSASYSHWWLIMRMTLSDGVSVHVDGVTNVKRKTAQKRKYQKIKDRLSEQLTIKLVPPRGKSFTATMQGEQWIRRPAAGAMLQRMTVRPRSATFEFVTNPATRSRYHGGWQCMGLEGLLDSAKVVAAIIHSYKLVSRAGKR
ncbi:MAG TPA: hypothetical protein VFB62_20875 [Polyangiaceae bacterium]|nr:hypothetical protein [Polyangiaceae bacterium]